MLRPTAYQACKQFLNSFDVERKNAFVVVVTSSSKETLHPASVFVMTVHGYINAVQKVTSIQCSLSTCIVAMLVTPGGHSL